MCKIPELPATIVAAQDKFEVALRNASAIDIVNNFGAAFNAAQIIKLLREALTDEVLDTIFMPLMNSKVGFRTDRDGKLNKKTGKVNTLYDKATVREAIIDAALIGLRPTGNQFNIISGTMYPTKEGYTSLLKKIGAKYIIDYSQPTVDPQGFATFTCKINYEYKGDKNSFSVSATVRTDQYSSYDQLRGKAERRAKKALYEYLTGTDYGEADETSSRPIDTPYIDMTRPAVTGANQGAPIEIKPAPAEPVAQPGSAFRPATMPEPEPEPQPGKAARTADEHKPAAQPEPETQTPGF